MKKLWLFIILLQAMNVAAQTKSTPIDHTEFTQDIIKMGGVLPNRQIAEWLPIEFWNIIAEEMRYEPDAIKQLNDALSPYMIFLAVEYVNTPDGNSYTLEKDLRRQMRLVDSAGNEYKPLKEEDLDPTAAAILAAIKPAISRTLGQMGSSMHLFCFDCTRNGKQLSFDVYQPNHFHLKWEDADFEWVLPFASVLPPKKCPVDGSAMKGNWNYCPFHGVKLK